MSDSFPLGKKQLQCTTSTQTQLAALILCNSCAETANVLNVGTVLLQMVPCKTLTLGMQCLPHVAKHSSTRSQAQSTALIELLS